MTTTNDNLEDRRIEESKRSRDLSKNKKNAMKKMCRRNLDKGQLRIESRIESNSTPTFILEDILSSASLCTLFLLFSLFSC